MEKRLLTKSSIRAQTLVVSADQSSVCCVLTPASSVGSECSVHEQSGTEQFHRFHPQQHKVSGLTWWKRGVLVTGDQTCGSVSGSAPEEVIVSPGTVWELEVSLTKASFWLRRLTAAGKQLKKNKNQAAASADRCHLIWIPVQSGCSVWVQLHFITEQPALSVAVHCVTSTGSVSECLRLPAGWCCSRAHCLSCWRMK